MRDGYGDGTTPSSRLVVVCVHFPCSLCFFSSANQLFTKAELIPPLSARANRGYDGDLVTLLYCDHFLLLILIHILGVNIGGIRGRGHVDVVEVDGHEAGRQDAVPDARVALLEGIKERAEGQGRGQGLVLPRGEGAGARKVKDVEVALGGLRDRTHSPCFSSCFSSFSLLFLFFSSQGRGR